jgi:hypothetical protein
MISMWIMISNHLKNNNRVENAGKRASTLEKCHFSITTAPQSATPLYSTVHPKHLGGTPWTSGRLQVDDRPEPLLPDSFLGGTAPRLRSLRLSDVPFPGSPKLLLCLLGPVSCDTSKCTNHADDLTGFFVAFPASEQPMKTEAPRAAPCPHVLPKLASTYPIRTLSISFTEHWHSLAFLSFWFSLSLSLPLSTRHAWSLARRWLTDLCQWRSRVSRSTGRGSHREGTRQQ